jgi:hypothetical protein
MGLMGGYQGLLVKHKTHPQSTIFILTAAPLIRDIILGLVIPFYYKEDLTFLRLYEIMNSHL